MKATWVNDRTFWAFSMLRSLKGGRVIASGDGGTEMDVASPKVSATGYSTAPVARLLVVRLCVGFCQKGLGVTF